MWSWKPNIPSDELWHSAKGSTWEDHKYIRKEGNRYIYKEVAKTSNPKDEIRRKLNDITDIPRRVNWNTEGDKHEDVSRIENHEYGTFSKKVPKGNDEKEVDYAYKSKKAADDTGYSLYDDPARDIIIKKYQNKEKAKRKRITAADKKRLRTK